MLNRRYIALAAPSTVLALLTAGCPKPPPDPVPAGCKPPKHCADEPAPEGEGPPPVGSQTPGPETR